MTVAHDGHDLTPASVNEKVTQLFTKFVTLAAPRLFALCREYCEDDEDWVFSWGAAFDHIAVLFSSSGKIIGTFHSANSALDLFSRTQDLRLVWVGPMIHKFRRMSIKTSLDVTKIINHLGLESATEADIDNVLDES